MVAAVLLPLEIVLSWIRSLTALAPFSLFADFVNMMAVFIIFWDDVEMFHKEHLYSGNWRFFSAICFRSLFYRLEFWQTGLSALIFISKHVTLYTFPPYLFFFFFQTCLFTQAGQHPYFRFYLESRSIAMKVSE